MEDTYNIKVFFSGEDEGYIATVKEFPYASAFGKTRTEALKEIGIVIELFLEDIEEEM